MTNPDDRAARDSDPQEQLRAALEQAQHLAEPWIRGQHDHTRFALASHVGDLSVLALALRD